MTGRLYWTSRGRAGSSPCHRSLSSLRVRISLLAPGRTSAGHRLMKGRRMPPPPWMWTVLWWLRILRPPSSPRGRLTGSAQMMPMTMVTAFPMGSNERLVRIRADEIRTVTALTTVRKWRAFQWVSTYPISISRHFPTVSKARFPMLPIPWHSMWIFPLQSRLLEMNPSARSFMPLDWSRSLALVQVSRPHVILQATPRPTAMPNRISPLPPTVMRLRQWGMRDRSCVRGRSSVLTDVGSWLNGGT